MSIFRNSTKDVSDPFVEVFLVNTSRSWYRKILQTEVISDNLDPIWNAHYIEEICDFADEILFQIWDKDFYTSNEMIGDIKIPIAPLIVGQIVKGTFPISLAKNFESKAGVPTLTFRVEFQAADKVDKILEGLQ